MNGKSQTADILRLIIGAIAEEREACAKYLDERAENADYPVNEILQDCAMDIRARGSK